VEVFPAKGGGYGGSRHLRSSYREIIRYAPVGAKLRVLKMSTPRLSTVLPLALTALVFVTSAVAGVPDRVPQGQGSALELKGGRGLAVITSNDGTVIVKIREGSITLVDYARGDKTTVPPLRTWGCEKKSRPNRKTYICKGQGLHVTIQDGAWLLTLRGRGIGVSGGVTGKLLLRGTRGTYSIDYSAERDWPTEAQTFKLGD
jgi:hypothetical protein